MIGEKTYYEILNIPENSSDNDIKEAYRNLIKVWHPDLHPDDDDAIIKTQEINEAYGVLSDPQKRVNYDRFLSIRRPFVKKQGGTQSPFQNTEKTVNEDESIKEDDYHNMSYEEYCEEIAKNIRKTRRQANYTHTDSNKHTAYVYKKENILDQPVMDGPIHILSFAIIMFIFAYVTGRVNDKYYIFPLILIIFAIVGVCLEIRRRNKQAHKAREEKAAGINSFLEADRWFELCLNTKIPLTECRKAFFDFSVKIDKYILQRFNSMHEDERKEFVDIIELLEFVIEYRER